MTQLEASVRKACRRQGGVGVDVAAHYMGGPNAGAVLRVAVAIMTFSPGVDAPGEVDDDVTLTLRSQPPMSLQYDVGVFEVLIDDAVDHGFSSKCAKMSLDIVCRKQHEVFRLAIQHDPSARVEHLIVCLQHSAKVVRGIPPSHRTRLRWNAAVLRRNRRPLTTTIVVEPGLEQVGRDGEHLGTGVGRVPVPRWASIEIIQGAAIEGRARTSGFMQWYVLRL